MDNTVFNDLVEKQLELCKEVLVKKSDEYATEDRLHNFKVAAAFQQCTPEQALFGFLTKHLVSISDMCKSGDTYSKDIWDEKIGDSINYLLLLKALTMDKKYDTRFMAN